MATQSNNTIALEDLCSLVVEQVKPENAGGSVYIGLEHVSPGKIFADSSGYAEDVQSHKYVFCKNDVLYGKLRPYLDKAILAKTAGICTTELLVLRPKQNVSPLFLACALHNKEFVDYAMEGVTGVQHPRTSWAHIKNYEIGELSPETLRKIGMLMAAIQQASFNNEKLLKLANELKHATMHKLFTCGLRGEPQKETEIGLVPESWEVEELSAHHSVVSGGTPSRGKSEYWDGGTIPWVKTTEITYSTIYQTEECISELGLAHSAAKRLPAGTLLLAMYGQGVTRGKVALLGIEAACNQACAAIRPLDGVVLTKYLYHFLSYRYEAIRTLAHGGQQQNLNLDIVKSLQLALPYDIIEQQEIIDILDAIDQKIDLHRRKKAVLEELFKSLLHKLMTGEIRVDDLDLSALEDMQPQAQGGAA